MEKHIDIQEFNKEAPETANTRKKSNFLRIILVLCLILTGLMMYGIPVISDALHTANNNSELKILKYTTPTPYIQETPAPSPSIEPVSEQQTVQVTPDGNITVSNYVQLELNDNHPSVETLQLRLMELGYLESDEPCTVYNESIQTAVSMFQRAKNTAENGIADPALQLALFDDNAAHYEVKLGDMGNDVLSVQTLLKSLGYYTGKVNGYFGTATEDALKAFQKKNKLTEDGIYNTDDRDLLFSENAKPFIDPTPTPKPKQKKKTTSGNTSVSSSSSSESGSSSSSHSSSEVQEVYPTGGTFNASGGVSGVLSVAEAQIGKQYILGDEGPDTFDCSGLVYYCYRLNGVSISRRSAASYASNDSWTYIDNADELRAGDLVFFKSDSSEKVSHVGICIGGGKMIDASSANGKVVKRSCTSRYWERNFVCGRRIFG